MSVSIALLILTLAATNVLAQQPGGWTMTGSPATHHVPFGTTSTLLKNGKVLVVGSGGITDDNRTPELYDPETGKWSTTGDLITSRCGHVAVLLADGKVLVAGGHAVGVRYIDGFLTSAELYDPASGTWSPAGNLSVPRQAHTGHLLGNGTVLVIGGETKVQESLASGVVRESYVLHNTAEIYDPATGEWSSAGTMSSAYSRHASTLLADGKVLVIGGSGRFFDDPFGRRAEIFDPTTRRWTTTGNLTTWRQNNPRATLLPDGKVLVAGGYADNEDFDGNLTEWDTAELFDPITGLWSATGRMNAPRRDHTAILLPGGKVLVAGGYADNEDFDGNLTEWDTAELFDPATGQWSLTGRMNASRHGHAATLLANGNVLVVGGYSNASWSTTAELYDPVLPLLAVNAPSYCIGDSWSLRISGATPNTWIRLAGTSNGQPWEIPNWRKTDDNGNYSETAVFLSGTEGTYTLYADVAGKVSNAVLFSVARCQIQLTLSANDYCTGSAWNLTIASDYPNAWMNLSGSTNNIPWEISNWRRTAPNGTFSETGTFVPGSEGIHTMRVWIGEAQSNLFSFRVSRCGP